MNGEIVGELSAPVRENRREHTAGHSGDDGVEDERAPVVFHEIVLVAPRKQLRPELAAEHRHGADIDELKVTTVYVDKAQSMKRFSARAKGRGNRIEKQTCHIVVKVGV